MTGRIITVMGLRYSDDADMAISIIRTLIDNHPITRKIRHPRSS
jgi:hypothetical protein